MTGKIEIMPSGDALGAEIRGVDLSKPLSKELFNALEQAFNEHSVICFRDQDLKPQTFIDYASHYGEPQNLYLNNYAMPGFPEILYVSNIQEDGEDIGHADAGCVWHTDMSFAKQPPRATVLHAREVPVTEDGTVLGDTVFASAVKAYESLSEPLKEKLKGKKVVHDVLGRRRLTQSGVQDNDKRGDVPLMIHPAVRKHPHTGKKAIYVFNGECVAIEGMENEAAVSLIDELAMTVIQEKFTYRHQWRVGDVLMWDNCAVQHLAIHDYALPLRRMMWRITVGYTDVYE
jgi:taurine dioxygenase